MSAHPSGDVALPLCLPQLANTVLQAQRESADAGTCGGEICAHNPNGTDCPSLGDSRGTPVATANMGGRQRITGAPATSCVVLGSAC